MVKEKIFIITKLMLLLPIVFGVVERALVLEPIALDSGQRGFHYTTGRLHNLFEIQFSHLSKGMCMVNIITL